MHFYCLGMLLIIALVCNMIPCLFQLGFVFFFQYIFFSSLIPSFSFFTPSKRTQNSFATTRQNLDVLLILIFIIIYSSLVALTYFYLFTLIYTYVLFILLYMNLIKLLKYGEYRNYDKIF